MTIKSKLISVLLLCTILCVSLSGCYSDELLESLEPHIDEEAFEVVGEPTMRYEYDEEFKCYDVFVEGIVQNTNTEEGSSSVFITFAIYDKDGNTIGTASGYCEYLEAGARWRFCAEGSIYYEPSSCKMTALYQYSLV